MENQNPISRFFSFKRLLLPILITAVTTYYLFHLLINQDFDLLADVTWNSSLMILLLFAFLSVLVRDIAYIYRIWELSDRKLSIWRCVQVIILWEFGSAITPASVGGISLAFFILHKEGIKPGKATSILMFCTYLDNVAFIIVFSLLFGLLGGSMFDLSAICFGAVNNGTTSAFRAVGGYVWIGFLVVAFFGTLLGFAIFIRPNYAAAFLRYLGKLRLLSKWDTEINHIADDLHQTSLNFKDRGFGFLFKVLVATIISWGARYALANILITAFAAYDLDQLAIFARQYVHRVIVMIPSTPGGSGIAELSFMALNCEFIKEGLSPLVALIWRGFNFYFYILLGVFILPNWINKVANNQS